MAEIKKIVLSGGPCGGKASALRRIKEHFENLGIPVYSLCEQATQFINGGICPVNSSPDFEFAIGQAQLHLEDVWMEYLNLQLLNEADQKLIPIRKERLCFTHDDQYFELDRFDHPLFSDGSMLLENELSNEAQEVALPPCLDIIREVTDDPAFRNAQLAKAA